MSRLLFADSAKADLLDAWLFIAEENMDAADGVIDAIPQEAHYEVLIDRILRLK